VEFLEGGPALPAARTLETLRSWTELGDTEAQRFSGSARYSLEFALPTDSATGWLLDLGRVETSARVRVNDRNIGTLWCAPFRIDLGGYLHPGRNRLEIEVTNLAANHVRDLDRRGVAWKYFYDANVVGKDYRPLDAAGWPPVASGLLGPVSLVPWQALRP